MACLPSPQDWGNWGKDSLQRRWLTTIIQVVCSLSNITSSGMTEEYAYGIKATITKLNVEKSTNRPTTSADDGSPCQGKESLSLFFHSASLCTSRLSMMPCPCDVAGNVSMEMDACDMFLCEERLTYNKPNGAHSQKYAMLFVLGLKLRPVMLRQQLPTHRMELDISPNRRN